MPPGSGGGAILSSLMRSYLWPGLVLWTRTQSRLFSHLSQPVLSALASQPRPRPTCCCRLPLSVPPRCLISPCPGPLGQLLALLWVLSALPILLSLAPGLGGVHVREYL